MEKRIPKWAVGGVATIVLAVAGVLGAHFEGTRYQAYQDSGGVWTICQGHTQDVHAGDTATPAQCRAYLQREMADAYSDVQRCIHVPLTIGQQAAFTDAVYNLGPSVVCNSTLQRMANAGHVRQACAQLARWVYADGKQLAGLVRRRAAEQRLCLEGLQ